jgi:mannose-6-phosphate isomerase-like protein (cupin superfamily)
MTSWVFRHLASSLEAREPSMVQCAFMRRRMLRRVRTLGPPGTRTVRGNREDWRPLAPGVDIKLLRRDERADNMTAFIRMQPGSALDAHVHEQTEECFLVRGEIFIGAHRLRAADMHVAAAGTTHAAITSPRGALLLVRAQLCR